MAKLEKFKRRLIRSVAVLRVQENKSEEEIWETLNKEISKNCKVLWERMRILTVKKLKRLLAAEDKNIHIPKFAQMSETDWLLFDLIIAHEDEDVIGKDELYREGSSSEVLNDLFLLVQRFEIESKPPESLAEAWTDATIFYNSTGHLCSPMLLQRRWYQLKQSTRQRFYSFWFAYGGSSQKFSEVQTSKPTDLQQEIARRFPGIVTAPFKSWEELIKAKLIVLPEEFDRYTFPKLCDDTSPDMVLMEPVIETIDIEDNSCDDNQCEEETRNVFSKDNEPILLDKIKMEPKDLPSEYEPGDDQSLKSHISVEVMSSIVEEEALLDMKNSVGGPNNEDIDEVRTLNTSEHKNGTPRFIYEEDNITEVTISKQTAEDIPTVLKDAICEKTPETNTFSVQQDVSEITNENIHKKGISTDTRKNAIETGIPMITNVFGNVDINNEVLLNNLTRITKTVHKEAESTVILLRENKNDFDTIDIHDSSDSENDCVNETTTALTFNNNDKESYNVPSPSALDNSSKSNANYGKRKSEDTIKSKHILFGGLRNYFDFKKDGIELVDDGIKYVEDDELEEKTVTCTENTEDSDNNRDVPESAEPKFDLKLLMQTFVYTTKLDDMNVWKNQSFHSVSSRSLIDSIIIMSKPERCKPFDKPNDTNNDGSFIDDVTITDNETDEIDRLELSSYLLKKPISRTYNPVTLCKNPDFNTRLKWLTVGFLSSSRNRFLLKICKPMTIDLSKTFERKLINGTMYLKNCNEPVETINDGNDINTASVMPSAMSVQSLLDNMILQSMPVELINNNQPSLVISFDGSVTERNKAANMQDVSKASVVIDKQRLETDVNPPQSKHINVRDSNTFKRINNQITNKVDPQFVNTDYRCKVLENNTVDDNDVELLPNTSEITIIDTTESDSVLINLNDNQQPNSNKTNLTTPESSDLLQSDLPNKLYSKKKILSSNRVRIPWRGLPSTEYVSWLQKGFTPPKEDDALITIDTLYKMLGHINGSIDIDTLVKCKNTKKKKKGVKRASENKEDSHILKKKREYLWDNKDPVNNVKKPNVTVLFAKKGRNSHFVCCWARSQINLKTTKLKKYAFKHLCQSKKCFCCCKNELEELVNSLHSESALKRACDSIESVVQRTHEPMPVQTHNAIKPITEAVAVQTDIDTIDLSDDSIEHEMHDISKPAIMTLTQESESSKLSLIDSLKKNGLKFDQNEKDDTSTTREIDILELTSEGVFESIVTTKSIHIASYNSIDHNKEEQQRIQTINISASASEIDPKDNSKLSKQEISIVAHKYSEPNVSQNEPRSRQQYKNQCKSNNGKNLEKKILVVNNEKKGNKENPLYIGKDKVLVTDIKLPSFLAKKTSTALNDSLSEAIIPKAIELVVSPTGELVCNLLPGADVDANMLTQLPAIMAAVQSQLLIAGGAIPPQSTLPQEINRDEVLEDLSEKEIDVSKEITKENIGYSSCNFIEGKSVVSNNKNNINSNLSSLEVIELKNKQVASKVDTTDGSSHNRQNLTDNVGEKEILDSQSTIVASKVNPQATEPVYVVNESSQSEQETNQTVEQSEEKLSESKGSYDTLSSNRKNLLSDLMEMSGIFTEDVTPPLESLLQDKVETTSLVPLRSILKDDGSVIDQTTNLPMTTNEGSIQNDVSPVTNISIINTEDQNQEISLSQFNTINTLSELKYAFENNGSFFKLDSKTGALSPIRVFIRKTPLQSDNNSDSVIDLTEDIDNTLERDKDDSQLKKHLLLKTYKDKPVKIFRSISKSNILKKHQSLLSQLNFNRQSSESSLLKSRKITIRDRLNLVEEQVSLNLDNLPEQISLVNNSAVERTQNKRGYTSDSSDDEPLIAKVKKKKNNTVIEGYKNPINATTNFEETDKIQEPSMTLNLLESESFTASNTFEDNIDESTTNLFELDHTDDDEDCILGV